MSWIDSHCHLIADSYQEDLQEVFARAKKAQVISFIIIGAGYGLEGNEKALKFVREHEDCYAAIGIHPHDADQVDTEGKYFKRIQTGADDPKVVALGEMGLDYHYDRSPREVQQRVFREQIRLAKELDKPIVIHTRSAWRDTLDILKGEGIPNRAGVFHCFGEGLKEAMEAMELGFYISVTGVITFKKSEGLRKTVEKIPLERLLIETDSPYLAPLPYRGKRNEPAWVVQVGEKIAEIKKIPIEEVSKATTGNAKRLFHLWDL